MKNISKELFAKLIKAQSAEEIAGLLKAEGHDETEAESIWQELEAHRAERELSEDELETVSGGWKMYDRDWALDGCCSSVEPGSMCRTNDACGFWDIVYSNPPVKSVRCPSCGGYVYEIASVDNVYNVYRCKKCKEEFIKYLWEK